MSLTIDGGETVSDTTINTNGRIAVDKSRSCKHDFGSLFAGVKNVYFLPGDTHFFMHKGVLGNLLIQQQIS